MRFHPSAHVLFVGTNDSQLWLFKIPSGEYKIMHGGSDTEILTLEILTNGKKKKIFVFFTQNFAVFCFLLQVNNVYVVMVMVILNYGILNNLQLFGNMIIVVKVIVQ
jgi:hypothetical protein